ncbi:MAG: DNA recombination protein RmuC [Chlamydiota bacterium]|nr:DNA recombination protein RmuC [Chlamydiota bacterium]
MSLWIGAIALLGTVILLQQILWSRLKGRHHSLEILHREAVVRHEEASRREDSFASEAWRKQEESFLSLATERLSGIQERAVGDLLQRQQSIQSLVTPLTTTLSSIEKGMRQIEKEREGERAALEKQLKHLSESTGRLSQCLRAPNSGGRWGELQLRRVLEVAGMINHCDFKEQVSLGDGKARPDVIVHLPGKGQVVVDAKTPSDAYLKAMEVTSHEMRKDYLKQHARHVRQHISSLSKKEYWAHLSTTPEFVVLFIPSDAFFSSALEIDPLLIEKGVEQGVVIATPTTLIGLLRTIAYGWKQERLSEYADEVRQLGSDLYKRLHDMKGHWEEMGKSLGGAVTAYNRAVGSMEHRVLVSARKLREMGAGKESKELSPLSSIDQEPTEPLSPGSQ